MNYERLSIGQMAKLNGVSEQALRLYDKENILKPTVIDPDTGYRYYHIIQSARLDMIQYMKAYGMTLKQMGEFLEKSDSEALKDFLAHQEFVIDDQIKELEKRKRAISRALENFHKYDALPKDGQMFMEYIPERWVYKYTSDKDLFKQDYKGYEHMLRELKTHLSDNSLSMTYFCNVGNIIYYDDIINGRFTSNDIFLYVDPEDDELKLEKLPAAMYYCVCATDFYEEKAIAKKLIDEIHNKGYEICGDYVCEVIVELPILKPDQRNMFYKIQIPVAFK